MSDEPIKLYLRKLDRWRRREGLSRAAMADELGIPPGTCANWYRRGKSKAKPSSAYTKWLKSFLLARDVLSVERFIEQDGPQLLQRIGFRKDMTVMDFGCGNGDYSLMLAQVVGPDGRVYSVDKNRNVLYEMMGRARGKKLDNIEPTLLSAEDDTPTNLALRAESIEAGWFSDVLHDGYFKEDELKRQLVANVHRILTADGFIAVHPVHMDQDRLQAAIEGSGFRLEHKYKEELLFHGGEFHRGTVFKFRSASGNTARPRNPRASSGKRSPSRSSPRSTRKRKATSPVCGSSSVFSKSGNRTRST